MVVIIIETRPERCQRGDVSTPIRRVCKDFLELSERDDRLWMFLLLFFLVINVLLLVDLGLSR